MKKKIKERIESFKNSERYLKWKAWTLNTSIPGFEKVPIYYIVSFLYKESFNDSISTRANSIAFSFIIALFPFLIFLFTLTAYLPIPDFNIAIRGHLSGILPYEAETFVFQLIDDIITQPRGTLLSVGFILTIYFSSNAMIGITQSFEKTEYETFTRRTGLQERLVAIKMTFQVGFLLILAAIIGIAGKFAINYVDKIFEWQQLTYYGVVILRYFIIFGLIYFLIGFIYRYAASVENKFKLFTPGALLAATLTILASEAFGYYVNNFANYNKFYGSLGTLIILMLWAQFNSYILLVGYELNVSIKVSRLKLDRLATENEEESY